jgi:hypothetical protein
MEVGSGTEKFFPIYAYAQFLYIGNYSILSWEVREHPLIFSV